MRRQPALQDVDHISGDERAERQAEPSRRALEDVPLRTGEPVGAVAVLDVDVGLLIRARQDADLTGPEMRSRAPQQGQECAPHSRPGPILVVVASDDHQRVTCMAPCRERPQDRLVGGGDDVQLPDATRLVGAESEHTLSKPEAPFSRAAQLGRDVAHPGGHEQPQPFGYCPARPGEAHHAQEIERVPVEHELGAPAAAPLSPGETVEPGLELLIVEEVLARNGAADGIYALTEVKVAHHDDAIGRGERRGRGVHVSDRGGPAVHL